MKRLSRREVLRYAAAAPALSMIQGKASAETAAVETPRWSLPPRRPVREIANAWIPMADGVRLSARIWTPANEDGAAAAPAPVVLEYLP